MPERLEYQVTQLLLTFILAVIELTFYTLLGIIITTSTTSKLLLTCTKDVNANSVVCGILPHHFKILHCSCHLICIDRV